MRTVRLRHLARVNPPTKAFDRLSDHDELTFLPMESVWPGNRLDLSRRRSKASVAVGYTRFQDGDVLVPKITPTFEAGRAVLVEKLLGGVGAGTTELHVLRPGPCITPRFLLYAVSTHRFLKVGTAEMYGVAGQQRVPERFLQDLPVRLPSIEEQRRIADFLDAETTRINEVIRLRLGVAARLRERSYSLREGLVEDLFASQGSVPLRRLATRVEQGASPQCDEIRRRNSDEWAVLKLSAVKDGEFHPQEHKRLPGDVNPVQSCVVRRGDLLVTRANTPALVGDVAVVSSEVKRLLLPDLIYRVNFSVGVNREYIAQVVLSRRVRSIIESVARGSSQSMVKLRGEDIKSWPIPRATEEQQKSLVLEVRKAMNARNKVDGLIRCQLALLAERRQALITAAVTGQFDVSTASGRNVTDGVTV